MEIDCGTCPAGPDACADCMVTALLGPGDLGEREDRALAVLVDAGLVPPLRDPRQQRETG